MTVAVYLPLLLGVPLWWLAPRLARRGSPAPAARTLAGIAVIAALCTTWSLGLLALTLFDDLPSMRAVAGNPALHLPEPVPDPVAVIAALLLTAGALRLTTELRRRLSIVRQLRAVGVPQDGVVVADLAAPMAVAIPGRPGHLLVTTAILRLLDKPERQVMFAHERAHLRHRHHTFVVAAAAAAAVNPLLIPAREAVGYLVERWADEEAATEVGNRDLTARAIARAALATVRPGPLLGIDGGVAVRRVQALAGPAPEPRRRQFLGALLLITACTAAAATATVEFVDLICAWF
jgi:hypothetical protein